MKVYFETGQDKGHDVRGIGVHTSQLTEELKNLRNKELKITDKYSETDVVHFTYFKPFEKTIVPFNKPKNPPAGEARQKWVLTIHDLIPLIYPTHYPPGIRGKFNFLRNKFILKKNIDAVITISETSKKDICRFLNIDPKKVFVTYLAAKKVFRPLETGNRKMEIQKKFGLPNSFALYTGDVNYNKNIPNLIKACKIAKLPLVITGKQAKEIEKMDLTHPELLHLKDIDFSKIIRLGFVDDKDLNVIFNLASVYVQPSFYEGFGLPALEAVACNTPLAVSKTQALVEILGSDLNYFDPKNPKDIAKKILKPNKNIKPPRKYSWEKCADDTLKVYEKIF